MLKVRPILRIQNEDILAVSLHRHDRRGTFITACCPTNSNILDMNGRIFGKTFIHKLLTGPTKSTENR